MKNVLRSKTATADADGNATVRFVGADMAFDVIAVQTISMDCDSGQLPEARLYDGPASSGRLIALNADGNSGQFQTGGPADVIPSGRYWTLAWTGATPGATMTAQLIGTEQRRA